MLRGSLTKLLNSPDSLDIAPLCLLFPVKVSCTRRNESSETMSTGYRLTARRYGTAPRRRLPSILERINGSRTLRQERKGGKSKSLRGRNDGEGGSLPGPYGPIWSREEDEDEDEDEEESLSSPASSKEGYLFAMGGVVIRSRVVRRSRVGRPSPTPHALQLFSLSPSLLA